MGSILAVCSSDKKGEKKKAITEGRLKESYGLVGDAHADAASHRQVSLLDMSSVTKMRALGVEVGPGDFAENLTTDGLDLASLTVGRRLASEGGVVLEVTQIGKECHSGCAIYQQVGTCIMPLEGIFVRVIKGGIVRPGDELNPI
jgi:MOSC domain-containing protein YiiM